MPGTKNPPTSSRFLRSINVETDYRENDALSGYVLTAGTRRALGRIAANRSSPQSAKAWTLTGPYGTGKSAFSVFAIQLLAPQNIPGCAAARDLLRRGDPDLFEELFPKGRDTRGLWPIVVTGSREPIQNAFLRALKASLVAISRNKNVARELGRVSKTLKAAINGDAPTDQEVVEIFKDAVDAICQGGGSPNGVFLLVDEMGKLLEYAASHPQVSDVYLLQHLAEFAARSTKTVLFVGVLHQDFAGYAGRLSANERAEWEKVRGRFEDVLFEEPAEEILRLIAAARISRMDSEGQKTSNSSEFLGLCDKAWKLHLAPSGLQKQEFLTLLSHAWPLHPLTSVLVGQIFKKMAQNERSAFSFLSSAEPFGLEEFARNQSEKTATYGLDSLYDYLLNAFGDGLYVQRNGKRWAEIEGILDRLPDASPLSIRVLKTIGVLNVIGEWRKIVASKDILDLAMAGVAHPAQVSEALAYLEKCSAIITRKYSNSFALWQGSDIDVDERIKEARGSIDPSQTLSAVAAQFMTPRPIVARRVSFESGTLRYFSVEFAHPPRLTELVHQRKSGADGRIIIALPNNAQEIDETRNFALSESCRELEDVIIVLPSDSKSLEMIVRELACIDWVKTNTPHLEGDAIARKELRARTVELQRQLTSFLDGILVPVADGKEKSKWFHKGKVLPIRSKRELNSLLSDIAAGIYPKTPVILNELLNRSELSSAAAAGRRMLIESMIEHGGEPDLGIQGTPPEKSMYLSLLQKYGLHRLDGDTYTFGAPSKSDPRMRELWAEIQKFFNDTEQQSKSVAELNDLLMKRPFGLREGPIPVLVCAALIASDSDVALYESGSFVPQLTISVFERLMKNPESFFVRRWSVTGVRATVFHQLAEMLGKSGAIPAIGKRQVLDVVRPLLRFYSQLTDYAKTTERISSRAIKIRTVLQQTREADQLLFVQLPTACDISAVESGDPRKIQGFLTELRQGLTDLLRCYDDLLTELTKAIFSAFSTSGTTSDLRANLTERACVIRNWAIDPLLKGFISRVLDRDANDKQWIEGISALLSEKPTPVWRDTDRAKFEVALATVSRLFVHLEALAFAQVDSKLVGSEPIRIGITRRNDSERERVIHTPPAAAGQIRRIERLIESALEQDGSGIPEISLAALARVVERLLDQHYHQQVTISDNKHSGKVDNGK